MDYQLLGVLRQAGLRNTQPRQLVFTTLKTRPALTIAELYQIVRPQLDRASMYRTLNLFRQLGIAQDIVTAGQRKIELTDRFGGHHHHLACSNCGRVVAIHDAGFENRIVALAAANGFAHQSHSFEVTGLCVTCRQVRQ